MKLILLSFLLSLFSTTNAAGVSHIDNKKLKELIEKDVPVIDVRTTSEWNKTGVIKDSYLMMFFDERGLYNLDKWLGALSKIANKKDPVVLICLSGSRSSQLANYLVNVEGYEHVYNVKRGIGFWIKESNPTVKPY